MSSTTSQPLLEGRTAVVTGGAQGIGFEIARSFVDAGAKVVLGDLNLDAAQAAADKLGGRDVARAVKDAVPEMHVHGFTALEVTEGARRLGEPLADYLTRLKEAGLRTLPGTAAEILDDEVRAVICPDKINTEEWLEAHRTAHSVGLNSNVTIMFGTVEHPRSWARHLLATRALQRETGGFTEFVGLPFVHMAAPLYLQHRSRRGPTFREVVLMHAVARITYRGDIDHVQASWVKLGLPGVSQLLQAGVDDLGGQAPGRDGIEDGLQVAAAPRGEHRDAGGRGHCAALRRINGQLSRLPTVASSMSAWASHMSPCCPL